MLCLCHQFLLSAANQAMLQKANEMRDKYEAMVNQLRAHGLVNNPSLVTPPPRVPRIPASPALSTAAKSSKGGASGSGGTAGTAVGKGCDGNAGDKRGGPAASRKGVSKGEATIGGSERGKSGTATNETKGAGKHGKGGRIRKLADDDAWHLI